MTNWRSRALALLLLGACGRAETVVNGRRSVVLNGGAAQLVIDLGGGSIVDFHLKGHDLNPLVWGEKDPEPLRGMGHFLCLDRWGAPSEAEAANGMPFHGEAARVEWRLVQDARASARGIEAEMTARLPMAGMEVSRRVRLLGNGSVFTVWETVTNRNKLGRVYNMVQHPTIGPPFLDENTLVDANARQGFMQNSPMPNPEAPAVYWPQALKDGQPVNLRRLTDDPDPNVVSFVIDDDYGWVTAANPGKGLLIGYIWKTSDYPWLNIWRHVGAGKPLARGLEFGTTGLHQPEGILVAKGRIFGRPIYTHLDAGQSVTRSYSTFLLRIPNDYRGVSGVSYTSGKLTLHERGAGKERDLTIESGDLF